jgi:hypothetical protein
LCTTPLPPPSCSCCHDDRSQSRSWRRCERVTCGEIPYQRYGGVDVRTDHWALPRVPQDQQTNERTVVCSTHTVSRAQRL